MNPDTYWTDTPTTTLVMLLGGAHRFPDTPAWDVYVMSLINELCRRDPERIESAWWLTEI